MAEVVKHESSDMAVMSFGSDLASAQSHSKWMAAAWSVLEDGTLKLSVTTWDFPTINMIDAVRMLEADLVRQKIDLDRPVHGPLQKADLRPRLTPEERKKVMDAFSRGVEAKVNGPAAGEEPND